MIQARSRMPASPVLVLLIQQAGIAFQVERRRKYYFQ